MASQGIFDITSLFDVCAAIRTVAVGRSGDINGKRVGVAGAEGSGDVLATGVVLLMAAEAAVPSGVPMVVAQRKTGA